MTEKKNNHDIGKELLATVVKALGKRFRLSVVSVILIGTHSGIKVPQPEVLLN